ncbi:MAG: Holliday junction branch migration protein RuvA [Alphaproteobacteria bacterium]
MISYLAGTVAEVAADHAVVDVNGVGYEVLCPGRTLGGLAVGKAAKLFTVLVVREDAHVLFGFTDRVERQMFQLLTGSVSGVGPRIGLSLLSSFNVSEITGAIFANQPAQLARASGVGKKLAEKIIVELKDRLQKLPALTADAAPMQALSTVGHDVASALVNLGYQPKAAETAAAAAVKESGESGFETVFRNALRRVVS